MSKAIEGRVVHRPGLKPHVERFLLREFSLPISSTGGTSTSAIAISFAEADSTFRMVEVRVNDLRLATNLAPAVGDGMILANLSTDAGVSSITNDYYNQVSLDYGTATGVRCAGISAEDSAISLDNAATHILNSATNAAGPGFHLVMHIFNPALATLHRTFDWEWQYLNATASGVVTCRGLGGCSATAVYNGLRIEGNGVTPGWYSGNVEVWAERLNYKGVRP